MPHWAGVGVITYRNGPVTLGVQNRYVGSGKYDALGTPANINDNHVSSRLYTQLSSGYRVIERQAETFEVFASIDNLFNVDPPRAPNTNLGYTNPALFDEIGMTFKLGVRWKL
jgi:outer membrane receptor protein involved in Fe transport